MPRCLPTPRPCHPRQSGPRARRISEVSAPGYSPLCDFGRHHVSTVNMRSNWAFNRGPRCSSSSASDVRPPNVRHRCSRRKPCDEIRSEFDRVPPADASPTQAPPLGLLRARRMLQRTAIAVRGTCNLPVPDVETRSGPSSRRTQFPAHRQTYCTSSRFLLACLIPNKSWSGPHKL